MHHLLNMLSNIICIPGHYYIMPDTWKHSPRLLVLLQQRCCITPKLENACGAIKKTRWLTQLQAIWERLTVILHHWIYPFFPSLFREDSPSKTTQLRCGFGPCIQFWGYHGTSTTLRVNWRLEISPSRIIPIATRQFALNQFAKIKGLDVIHLEKYNWFKFRYVKTQSILGSPNNKITICARVFLIENPYFWGPFF